MKKRVYILPEDTANKGRIKINEQAIDVSHDASDLANLTADKTNKLTIITDKNANDISNTNDRIDNLVGGTTQDGEVIDSRKPEDKPAFPTLGERLNDFDRKVSNNSVPGLGSSQVYEFFGLGSIESYYMKRLKELALLNNTETFNMVAIMDNHHQMDQYSPNSLKHYLNASFLTKLTKVDSIVLFGDNINGYYDRSRIINETMQMTNLIFNAPDSEVDKFILRGNHDNGYGQGPNGSSKKRKPEEGISDDELKIFYKTNALINGEIRKSDSLYFYKDYEDYKIRLIGLDNFDIPKELNEDGTFKYNIIDQGGWGFEQLKWLATEALNVPIGYHVLITQHACVSGTMDKLQQFNTQVFLNIVEAFQNKNNISITIDGENIPLDYSKNGGNIIGIISGHRHENGHILKNGINYIDSSASLCYSGDNRRKVGTYTEDSWELINIDTNTRSLKLFKYGYGADRSFTY